jgi:hypothetical protein
MKKKSSKPTSAPDTCPLLFEKDGVQTCSVKLIPCKIYKVYGFCPIHTTWKNSRKFCAVHLEKVFA